jgi:hypothetical protein
MRKTPFGRTWTSFFCPKKRGPSSSRLGNLPVPSICIVPAGQNVFLEGGFHETSVLLDHSLDVPTAWRETWDLALKTSLCLDAFAMLWALYAEILSMENLGFFFFFCYFSLFQLNWVLSCWCFKDLSSLFQVVRAESRSTVSRRMRRARRTSSSVSTKIFMWHRRNVLTLEIWQCGAS